jgi:hypothetical protein
MQKRLGENSSGAIRRLIAPFEPGPKNAHNFGKSKEYSNGCLGPAQPHLSLGA